MTEKYSCYPLYLKIFVFVPLCACIWGFFLTRAESEDIFSSLAIAILGIILLIAFLMLAFRKVEIDDKKITTDEFAFFKKRTILISEINDFHTKFSRDSKVLILEGNGKTVKLLFCKAQFVKKMREILRNQVHEKIQQDTENIKKHGFYIGTILYTVIFTQNGIENSRTKTRVAWENINCTMKESKYGKQYTFFTDRKIPVKINYDYFAFAVEDFFDEMSKKMQKSNNMKQFSQTIAISIFV